MKILHYIPSIDHSAGGTATYMQLLAKELGKFVDLHIVTYRSKRPVTIENAHIHYLSTSFWQWIMQRHHWTRKAPALYFYQKKAIQDVDYIHATAESEKQNLL
jgi:hypothetical protein